MNIFFVRRTRFLLSIVSYVPASFYGVPGMGGKNLRIGIKEMEDSGYYLKSLNFENRIQAIENELNDHLKQVGYAVASRIVKAIAHHTEPRAIARRSRGEKRTT